LVRSAGLLVFPKFLAQNLNLLLGRSSSRRIRSYARVSFFTFQLVSYAVVHAAVRLKRGFSLWFAAYILMFTDRGADHPLRRHARRDAASQAVAHIGMGFGISSWGFARRP
jgi:hypothetical protein